MIKLLKKYITRTFFLNAPLVVNSLVSLITLPIVLANLPVADYGKWQFVLALQTWLLAFSAKNITPASKKGLANNLNGTFLYAFFTRLKFLIPIGLITIFIGLILKFSRYFIFSPFLIIIGVYLILGLLPGRSFFELLIAKKRFQQWCFWQILTSLSSRVGSTIIAWWTKDIIYFVCFQLGSTTIFGLLAWLLIVKKENLITSYKKGKIDRECKSFGVKLIPIDIIALTAGKISYFIIGSFFGFTNLAIFSIANKLRDHCAGVIKSVRPLLYADFAKIKRKDLTKIINRYLTKIGLIGLILTLGFIGAGWAYIKLFLPVYYQPAIIYFIILSTSLPFGLLSIILHTILESHLRYKELATISIIPNIIEILLTLIFGYFWGMIGICITLTINGLINFSLYYLLTLKREMVVKFVGRHQWLDKLSQKY